LTPVIATPVVRSAANPVAPAATTNVATTAAFVSGMVILQVVIVSRTVGQ
jgi:hypothetical protein